MSKSYKSDYITLQDFYKQYNYPCQDLNKIKKGIVPLPYIPKDKINCNHKYSLTYKEWKTIIMKLFYYLVSYLLTGKDLELPFFMGHWRLKKYKPNRKHPRIDLLHYMKTGEKKFIKFPETDGYEWLFKWKRSGKNCKLKYKWHWKVKFIKSVSRRINQEINKNPSIIYRFTDI